MPVVAKIVFTGLAVIVSENVDNAGYPPAVVFPNAESASHVTYIAVPESRFELVASDDRQETVKSPLHKKYTVARLHGEAVRLLTRPLSSSLTSDNTPYERPAPLNLQEAKSLHWLPDMSRVFPRLLRTERPALPEFVFPQANPELVSARFAIEGGHLETSWMTSDVWRIAPRTVLRRRLEQAFAQEVTLSFEIAGPDLVFEAKPIDDPNGPTTTITIRRKTGSGSFTVLFANTRLEDVAPSTAPSFQCTATEPGFECLGDHVEHPCHCVDPHFRMYYRMFEKQPDDSPVPHLVEHGRFFMVNALRVGGANCGPGRYK